MPLGVTLNQSVSDFLNLPMPESIKLKFSEFRSEFVLTMNTLLTFTVRTHKLAFSENIFI